MKNNKVIQNKFQLPLTIELPIAQYYGSYSIYYKFNNQTYDRAACFAAIYNYNIGNEKFKISFYLNPKNPSITNLCPFNIDFIKYYLNILQEYFNFSYSVGLCKLKDKLNWIEIKCTVYTPGLGSLKTFTTAVRFLFEESRSTMLLIALYYLQNSEENVNLFTILSILEKYFTHNSGHSLTNSRYLCLCSKEQLQKTLHSETMKVTVHDIFGTHERNIKSPTWGDLYKTKKLDLPILDKNYKFLTKELQKLKKTLI